MMSLVGYVWVASVVIFFCLLILVSYEQAHQRRIVAITLRLWLDTVCERIGSRCATGWEHFIKYIVQLNWYYSIHSVLQMILRLIVGFYTYFENLFERNRARAKRLRAEKRLLNATNHLQKMAEHKEDTALSEAEKRKLRHKKLEETH